MLNELINSSLSETIIVVIMAALPVSELRVSLPVAVNVLHMPLLQSLFLSIIGNLLPVPFLLLFYESLTRLIIRTDKGKRFYGVVI